MRYTRKSTVKTAKIRKENGAVTRAVIAKDYASVGGSTGNVWMRS